jgi:phospholipid/cholesterol/gamma-HCH transport system permease protein
MLTDAPGHTEARWHRWHDADGSEHVELSGDWTLSSLAPLSTRIDRDLSGYARDRDSTWDLRRVTRLDDAAASLILRAWNWRLPARLNMKPEHAARFAALEHTPARSLRQRSRPLDLLVRLGQAAFSLFAHAIALITLLGRLLLDVLHLVRHPAQIPWREISANIHRTGGEALPITALVGFLIGVVLSYLSALQLRQYGADLYIINVVGIGITRELGPLLAAILVAGRSGSSMTAQLGVMRVTQELDALSVMGISHTVRLVLPKVIALSITLPLLITWTDAVGLIGGALVAQDQLGIAFGQFMRGLPDAVPVANLWLGWGKAVLFGALIAVVACHYGLRIKPNTESLGINTTASVVTAITLVIVIDAGVAVLFRHVGFY